MAKRATLELKAAIRRYHRDGWSYYALAKIVPYSAISIAKWCDPDLKSRQAKSSAAWIEQNGAYQTLTEEQKSARRASSREWKRRNKERCKARQTEYRQKNRARLNAKTAEWRTKNPDKHRAATERWAQANKDYIKAKRKERYAREKAANPDLNKENHARHREKRNAESRAYRAANPEKMRQLDRDYRQNNPDKNAAKAAKARADRAQATPPWLTRDHLEEIESFYSTAKALEQAFGGRYDVDHIHPINGRTCCGLHVPWNLQVLPAHKNRQKSNKLV